MEHLPEVMNLTSGRVSNLTEKAPGRVNLKLIPGTINKVKIAR
jgi:hypothetical protein